MQSRRPAGRRLPRTPHAVLALALTLALGAVAPAAGQTAAPTAPLDEAGYWRIADATVSRLDDLWNEGERAYLAGGGGSDPAVNSSLLYVHAVAAQRGHDGPARNDHRGRLIARRLTQRGPFVDRGEPAPAGDQRHTPGWTSSLGVERTAGQHLVFDAEIVDGLTAAYRARRALDLPDATADLIRDRITRTVAGPFWRWPAIRLNQINWYALMYASAATVGGDTSMLRRDLALQIRRFVAGIRGRGGAAGNLGPGARVHYLPHKPLNDRMNVDSAEYANIVMSVSRFLDQARAAGMTVPASDMARLRAWARRVIAGYWTHGGYLNWDSGLGFERWHQSKKVGLSAQALIGLASSDALGLEGSWRSWAKYLLDRNLLWFERQSQRAGGVPPALFFGVDQVPQPESSARLGAARIAGNAARAIAAGLGRRGASTPPPLYAYDPDTGRLAVTTRHYNTAVVPTNQGAFPYGGLEMARLFDGDGDVAGTIGGLPPASFGMVVADAGGRRVLATQSPRRLVGATSPLRLTRAPSGVGASASQANAGRSYAGPFGDLRATGTTAAGALRARVSHRFTSRAVETAWRLRRSTGRATYTVRVLFPSTGAGAGVEAVLRSGRRVTVGTRPLALARVSVFLVRSERSGYVVRPLRRPAGATAAAVPVPRQSSAPRPGRSLVIRVARGRIAGAAFAARMTVRPDLAVR